MRIEHLAEHLNSIYRRSNRVFIDSLAQRIGFLNLALAALQDTVRKRSEDKAALGRALARVVSFIFCVAEHFDELPVEVAMREKYPAGRCGYCQLMPCVCAEQRPTHSGGSTTIAQAIWSFRQWQDHLNLLYGDRNRQSGLENVLNRLFKEVTELFELQMGVAHSDDSLDSLEREFALEIADALAWTFAVAILLEIDLEQATMNLYGSGCPTCTHGKCQCGRFVVDKGRIRRLPMGLGSSSLFPPELDV